MTAEGQEIAVADNLALDGPPRPWPVPGMLTDLIALDRALPPGAKGGLFAYGEIDQIGKPGANLAMAYRGPAGITVVGDLAVGYGKPLKARIMLAKVFY